jgi:hypothetical protein
MTIDIEALRDRLAEYDPDAPRCTKTVAESRNYAPSHIHMDDPEWSEFTVTTHNPCCRPSGHDGECRNSRRVMGWPGRTTISALLDEVECLRKEIDQTRSRAGLDDLLARVEQGARAVERAKIVAWLRRHPGVFLATERIASMTPFSAADAIERGEHLIGDTTTPIKDTRALYGYCPICGGLGRSRERRPNGNDRCENGHSYASNLALPTTLSP